jgi:hypothetical protein
MELPWKNTVNLNIASNEYTTKLSINRCLSGLVANDEFLDGALESSLDRSTGLRFATRTQIAEFDSVSGGISPANVMVLSASNSEILTGAVDDRFITPNILNQAFNGNVLIPKIVYIDITHIPKVYTVRQIVTAARDEINNARPLEGSTIYVRCIWHSVSETTSPDDRTLSLKSGQVVSDVFFTGTLTGHQERIFTFRSTEIVGGWEYIRNRETFLLTSNEQADGYKSLF